MGILMLSDGGKWWAKLGCQIRETPNWGGFALSKLEFPN